KRLVAGRMPVLGQDDMLEAAGERVDDRHYLVAARHGEGAARTEIVLDVDDDEDVLFAGREAVSHGGAASTPARRRSVSAASFSSEAAMVTGYADGASRFS